MAVSGAFLEQIGRFYGPSWGFIPGYRRATWAWAALAALVVGWNVSAREGQMLSEQADRWIARHPLLARVCIAVIAAHVANLTPSRLDPIHLAFTAVRRLR